MKTPAELAEAVVNFVADADAAGDVLRCTRYADLMVWELVSYLPGPSRVYPKAKMTVPTVIENEVLRLLNPPNDEFRPDPMFWNGGPVNWARFQLAYRRNRAENLKIPGLGDW